MKASHRTSDQVDGVLRNGVLEMIDEGKAMPVSQRQHVIVAERARALLQDGILTIFDSPNPEPGDSPILALDMRLVLHPTPLLVDDLDSRYLSPELAQCAAPNLSS